MSIEYIYPVPGTPDICITTEKTADSEVRLTLYNELYDEELGFPLCAADARKLGKRLIELAHMIDGRGKA